MSKSIVYPTGVENHGGFLRIWFIYQGKRYREATGLPDTPKNRNQAGEIRQSVQYEIRSGIFDYYHRFPESKNAENFSTKTVKQITIKGMFDKWLELKQPEISLNTYNRYVCKLDTCAMILGEKKHIDSITQENLLYLRNELLTGNHRPARQRKVIKKGRTVATVNDYIVCVKGVLRFAYENGYIDKDPTPSVRKLKKSRTPPDPFNQDEFSRFIESCNTLQSRNLWTVAFYTGIRPGELSSLAWEDIDLDAGTITVRRNWTSAKQYTLPKTNAGTNRVIVLLEPAINALKAQMSLTYMRESVKVDVHLREFGRIRKDKCTFVFKPNINARGYTIKSDRYSTSTLGDMWDRTIKKAKIRHRNAYQTRHTYACWMLSAGANPSFLATQMGHSSAQMIFTVYGDWMPENNDDQVEMLNAKLSSNAPSMPHRLKVV